MFNMLLDSSQCLSDLIPQNSLLSGSISSITVLGQTLVILNDVEAASDLLDKRSAINSSRPKMVFGGEM